MIGRLALLPAAAIVIAASAPGLTISGVAFVEGDIAAAETGVDEINGSAIVRIRFTPAGALKFQALQRGMVGKPLPILFDGMLLSSPILQEEIMGNDIQISGNLTTEEAKRIAAKLAPVPVAPQS